MAEIGSFRYNSLEDVTKHETVNLTVLALCGFTSPGNIQDVGHIGELRKLRLGFGSVGDVALDVLHRMVLIPIGAGTSGHVVDFPWTTKGVVESENLRQTVADNTGNSYYQGQALGEGCLIRTLAAPIAPDHHQLIFLIPLIELDEKGKDYGVTTIVGGKWGRGSHVDWASEDAKFSNDFDVVYIGSSCSLLVVDRGNRVIREIQLYFDDCAYQYGSVAMKTSTTGIPYQKPINSFRPPLIPTEEEQKKHEESLFGSLGKLVINTWASIAEILGGEPYTRARNILLQLGHSHSLITSSPSSINIAEQSLKDNKTYET
ncbi:unnamed protein product [Dovyalis caffra]|uniref:Uncharacterized protein n=1 Tax=Dovyalis caffra TaxID=77055 RepID=A0AAV1SNW5_9ROSI|nr:unnamed protein product [Dovyalis caffra]